MPAIRLKNSYYSYDNITMSLLIATDIIRGMSRPGSVRSMATIREKAIHFFLVSGLGSEDNTSADRGVWAA
jgi:hypothetical protein